MRFMLLFAILFPLLDEFDDLLERLRRESPGEYEKVRTLDHDTALEFLRKRYGGGETPPQKDPAGENKTPKEPQPLPGIREDFTVSETIAVGECEIQIGRSEDGAFGRGEVRRGDERWRRADFPIVWTIDGKAPKLGRRDGLTLTLVDPAATLEFSPARFESAGTTFVGFRVHLKKAGVGPVVERASWELGGSVRGLTYFDGYRGWSGPPAWQAAESVPETNPELAPTMLHGTGFQLVHGRDHALLLFHASPGDRLKNATRGECLCFETTWRGSSEVDRYVVEAEGRSRTDLWTRAFEVAQGEERRVLGIPERKRESWVAWEPFGKKGFRETAEALAGKCSEDGFTGVCLNVIWDNIELHGGAKNMNIRDLAVAEPYGGVKGLGSLVHECRRRHLTVNAWAPAGHLNRESPLWTDHPLWVMRNAQGGPAVNPGGLWQGDLETGFRDWYAGRLASFLGGDAGLDGYWMDSHLAYAQQKPDSDHELRLAEIYRDLIRRGADLVVEGDASVFGSYGIAIDESRETEWKGIPPPDLFYDSNLSGAFQKPDNWKRHFREYAAAGALWTVPYEILHSKKLSGDDWDDARAEIRAVLADVARFRNRMVHRFANPDGSGWTWTNDEDGTKVAWMLKDGALPDGAKGEAGRVYEIGKE